ncbi:WD40 repeat domain 95 [Geranomyces variabilis]|uniref:WD40 repeat domain 95 n=1 Tax=Geranomyces variabilis TaxID=109894 RepID=A0AAD5TWS8_9FUNG|nr:WD40 repeat domain 95 [Geranomyces variabilis]
MRDSSSVAPGGSGNAGAPRAGDKAGMNVDVQQYMNMNHFEQLMVLFQSHENEDGSTGFDIDKFREVFGKVVGGNLTHDQMTMLFMKIDANSDGTVDWDEFSTYMMTGALENSEAHSIFDERIKKLFNSPHKDTIRRIDYIPKERKYISVSRDGTVCFWAQNLKLQRVIPAKDFSRQSWVADSLYLPDHNRLVTITDDRHFCVYDIMSIKPRLIITMGQLENNPLCLAYGGHMDEERDFILFGDDGGYVNVLTFTRKFITENEATEELSPAKLSRRESLKKYNASFSRRKIHNDWVVKVQYYSEINAFISCAPESIRSLIIGDLERKSIRFVNVPKGIACFAFCRRPSFLVTGGRDKIIRLWNPYVLSKPAGTLHGHSAGIVNISINHEEGHIISLSEDRVIKVWNARSLNCLQTLAEKVPQKVDELISVIFFDQVNGQLVLGSDKLQTWPLYKTFRHALSRSHNAGVVAAMFNENFHQVVSGAQDGTVCIWDIASGERAFSFHNAHGKLEITAMCFDRSGRRLITGSRDGLIKMWNFNNGQILRKMMKDNVSEATDVLYVEMGANRFIVSVGWDRKVVIFLDDPAHFEAKPVRVMQANAYKGHQDDISSVAFRAPSMLATSSVDGIIVIWSLESGYMKLTLSEPFLDLRSKEEKPIEKIIFLPTADKRLSRAGPLVSCHADGCLRFWDTYEGLMLYETNCQVTKDEGLGTMALSSDGNLLIVGGSKGHVRVFTITASNLLTKDLDSVCAMKQTWRAHLQSISSVNYANAHDVILTASKDATIRVWTSSGTHIGIFGQNEPWILGDPSTYRDAPEDVQQASRIEAQHNQMIVKHQEGLKKNVIDTWRGLPKDSPKTVITRSATVEDPFDDGSTTKNSETKDATPETGMTMADMKVMRFRALQTQALTKWCDVYNRRKSASDWMLSADLTKEKESEKPEFFALKAMRRHQRPPSYGNIKYDAVYHMLAYYPLAQIEPPTVGGPGAKKHRADNIKQQPQLPILRKDRATPISKPASRYGAGD